MKSRIVASVCSSRVLLLLAAGVALAGFAGLSYARLAAQTGTVTVCAKKKGGQLRLPASGSSCGKGERRLTLDREGPKGERGPAGAAGPVGPIGPEGPRGSAGPPGQTAQTVVDGGSCDDIQAAIDGLPAAGGAVLVKAGTYTCDGSVVIDRDDVSLRGVGPATVLRLADEATEPVLVVGQTIENPTVVRRGVRVADLAIDGNRTHQEYECSGGPCEGGEYLHNNGVSLRHVEDVRVENVTVTAARSGGLVVDQGSRRVEVRDLNSSDNEFDGLGGYETEDSLFTGLFLHDNKKAGLTFDDNFNHNTVSDAVIAHNDSQGLFMRYSRDDLFSDVQIRDSGLQGAFLAQVGSDAGTPAAGNTFTGLVVSDSGRINSGEGFGMRVNDATCTENLVTSSQFIEDPAGGISEASSGLVHQFAVITRSGP